MGFLLNINEFNIHNGNNDKTNTNINNNLDISKVVLPNENFHLEQKILIMSQIVLL